MVLETAPSGPESRRFLLEIKARKHWSNRHLANALGLPILTVTRWAYGLNSPTWSGRRLLWLVWMSTFHPTILARPDSWLRWYGVRETEGMARLKKRIEAQKERSTLTTPQPVVVEPKPLT